jgi:tetratricopeptide (TPR) repeat protein
MDLADPEHRVIGGWFLDQYTAMLMHLAFTLACLGYVDQARSKMEEALSEARRLGNAHSLAGVLDFANRLDWITRSPMVYTEEFLALTTEHRFPFYLGWALSYCGRSLIAQGQAQEGVALLTQGLAGLRATGGVAGTSLPLGWLAEAHAALRQPVEERNCLAEAAHFIETTQERFLEAELLHRVPGDLLNAAGDQPAAEQHYRQAIILAERQSARLFQLRASTSLARLWRYQGKRTEARYLLGPIYYWFTEGFDAPDLKDAKALLNELA